MSEGSVTRWLIVRHLAGARAREVDEIAWPAHREVVLGRAPSAGVRFDARRDRAVGRFHARIEVAEAGDAIVLRDLGSRNGTFVNGVRVTDAVTLRAGDRVRLGSDGPEFEVALAALATRP